MARRVTLDRVQVQAAMKRPLFLLMDGTTIVPILTIPIMLSWTYLKCMAVFYVCMGLIALTSMSPIEFLVHIISKFNQGNNQPYKNSELWKPSNR